MAEFRHRGHHSGGGGFLQAVLPLSLAALGLYPTLSCSPGAGGGDMPESAPPAHSERLPGVSFQLVVPDAEAGPFNWKGVLWTLDGYDLGGSLRKFHRPFALLGSIVSDGGAGGAAFPVPGGKARPFPFFQARAATAAVGERDGAAAGHGYLLLWGGSLRAFFGVLAGNADQRLDGRRVNFGGMTVGVYGLGLGIAAGFLNPAG